MVNEINRLVGDLLAGGGEVFLPGVGSLYTERRGARRISRRSVLPPSRAVSFTSQERGVSLVAEISGAVQCDAAEAQDVYDRWLARTLENGVLTIEGVGVLKLKHFTPDSASTGDSIRRGVSRCGSNPPASSTGPCGSALRRFWSPSVSGDMSS